MSEEALKTIWIITDEEPQLSTPTGARDGSQDTGGLLGGYRQPDVPVTKVPARKRVAVPAEKLKEELSKFLHVVGDVFNEAKQHQTGMQLEEVELSVEVNGEGQVGLLGIGGGKAGGKGAITLRFKLKDSQ